MNGWMDGWVYWVIDSSLMDWQLFLANGRPTVDEGMWGGRDNGRPSSYAGHIGWKLLFGKKKVKRTINLGPFCNFSFPVFHYPFALLGVLPANIEAKVGKEKKLS